MQVSWWADFERDDPVRQGDVIRKTAGPDPVSQWGVVVTADCDIVQGKAGDRVTWLSVVPAVDYLRHRWAPDQLRRLFAKQARPAAEMLTAQLRAATDELDPITVGSLADWLKDSDAAAICEAVSPGRAPDAKLMKTLTALRMAAGHHGPEDPLARLHAAWTALGRDANARAGAIREALEGERGFPDFFLLPDLPRAEGIGHVVLLRDIASIHAGDIFATEQDARIADQPQSWHRVARLGDNVRFAITQKLAFLFSRIGLPSAFEHACTAATELVVEAASPGDPL